MMKFTVSHNRQIILNPDYMVAAVPAVCEPGDIAGTPSNGRVCVHMANGEDHELLIHWEDFVDAVKAKDMT